MPFSEHLFKDILEKADKCEKRECTCQKKNDSTSVATPTIVAAATASTAKQEEPDNEPEKNPLDAQSSFINGTVGSGADSVAGSVQPEADQVADEVGIHDRNDRD